MAAASPLILATWSFGRVATAAGWPMLGDGGNAIDAVERACCAVEDDPDVNSVGIGGIPDRSGQVSLDGCIMESPSRCGAAACVRRFPHPVSIARRVMERTEHVMLAGDGADAFAESQGFAPADLLTTAARTRWEAARRSRAERDDLTAANREERTGPRDTVGVLALDNAGTLAGACSTSGWPLKLPGRVGDSPIIGHGLYVDPAAGAAVATGSGELVMGVCGSFLAVERMRAGDNPLAAVRFVLTRILDAYDLSADDQVAMIALRPDGTWSAAALRDGFITAVRSDAEDTTRSPEAVLIPAARS